MAIQGRAAGGRDGWLGHARRAALQRDCIGAFRSHPGGPTDRGGGARLEVVSDAPRPAARTLNASRRWGYRLLPGDLYSYLLHMRPAEWPIMAGHTLLGYVLAAGFTGVGRGMWLGEALLALGIWVIFLNGGTLAINSVFDK